jgi:hypothetical protein
MSDRRERVYAMPGAHCDALAHLLQVTRAEIARVKVVEHSRFARWHRAAATTRRNAIYLSGSGAAFAADPTLMLHEYFHVLRQWNAGALTVARYVAEAMRHGYARNRFEVEARTYAAAHAGRLTLLLRDGGGGTGAPAAGGHAVRDFSPVSRP